MPHVLVFIDHTVLMIWISLGGHARSEGKWPQLMFLLLILMFFVVDFVAFDVLLLLILLLLMCCCYCRC